MSFKNKISLMILICFAVSCFVAFPTGAVTEKQTAIEKFYSAPSELICVSHRGDTEFYPENSLQGINSALDSGADFVSVSVDKTKDGVFYLAEAESIGNICNAPYESLSQMDSSEADKYNLYDIYGNLTEYKLTSLEKLIKKTDNSDGIILDVKTEDKEAVYGFLSENNALDRMIIRVKESPSKLISWAESKNEKVYVIGVYRGNIIFNTISSINKATDAEMPAIQYASKNYFNVAYGDFFTNRYNHSENARSFVATYSPDLCGQRGDSSDGWNELIGKGYSAIETDNVKTFVAYREEVERIEKSISELLEKAFNVDPAKYSEVSLSNLEAAVLNCKTDVNPEIVSSLDDLQKDYSQLIFALEDMKISTGEVNTKGALNVTAGKIIAAILVGAALLAGQIYVYKMRRTNKEKK